jgi:hypothetical protein
LQVIHRRANSVYNRWRTEDVWLDRWVVNEGALLRTDPRGGADTPRRGGAQSAVDAATLAGRAQILRAGLKHSLVDVEFTGAAACINVAEQPAPVQLDNRSLLVEWRPT